MAVNCYVVGLGGATCSGKSTIADRLVRELGDVEIEVVKQDDFYKDEHQIEYLPHVDHHNWDSPLAVNFDKICDVIQQKINGRSSNKRLVIVVDGNMIFCHDKLSNLCQKRFFFLSSFERCKQIRDKRTYEPPDKPTYFEKVVWPAYLRHEEDAKAKHADRIRFEFLDDGDYEANYRTICIDLRKWLGKEWLMLTEAKLNIDDAVRFVTTPEIGAVATFIGTTRNSFDGKAVVQLKYECYNEMAYKEMKGVCDHVRQSWPQVDRIVIFHRLGTVPVEESSVIIAISAPHRKESFLACEFAIDHLKKCVPIWKKEIYSDGSDTWKENERKGNAKV